MRFHRHRRTGLVIVHNDDGQVVALRPVGQARRGAPDRPVSLQRQADGRLELAAGDARRFLETRELEPRPGRIGSRHFDELRPDAAVAALLTAPAAAPDETGPRAPGRSARLVAGLLRVLDGIERHGPAIATALDLVSRVCRNARSRDPGGPIPSGSLPPQRF